MEILAYLFGRLVLLCYLQYLFFSHWFNEKDKRETGYYNTNQNKECHFISTCIINCNSSTESNQNPKLFAYDSLFTVYFMICSLPKNIPSAILDLDNFNLLWH